MDAIQNICVNVFYIYGCQEALLESVGFRLSLEFSSALLESVGFRLSLVCLPLVRISTIKVHSTNLATL